MLSKQPPKIADGTFNELSCSEARQAEITAKYHRFFAYWLRSGKKTAESRLGSRYVGPNLYKCVNEPLILAIFIDQYEYFNQHLETDIPRKSLYKWFLFSCAVGADNIGTTLMTRLELQPEKLEDDIKNDILVLIGASGNKDWLRAILVALNEKHVPDICFQFPGLSERTLRTLKREMEHCEPVPELKS